MAGKKKHSTKKIIKAIKGTGGIISEICRNLSCARQTFYSYLQDLPEVRQAFEYERDEALDEAESVLINHLEGNSLDAAIYMLDCRGADRGYGRKQQNQATSPNFKPLIDALAGASKEVWADAQA